jgi:hypothetical protein
MESPSACILAFDLDMEQPVHTGVLLEEKIRSREK